MLCDLLAVTRLLPPAHLHRCRGRHAKHSTARKLRRRFKCNRSVCVWSSGDQDLINTSSKHEQSLVEKYFITSDGEDRGSAWGHMEPGRGQMKIISATVWDPQNISSFFKTFLRPIRQYLSRQKNWVVIATLKMMFFLSILILFSSAIVKIFS